MTVSYPSFSSARANLKAVFDAAEADIPVHLQRGDAEFAVVKSELLTALLSKPGAVGMPELYQENDGWSIVLPGTPIAADSAEFNEAVEDFMLALREYVDDWVTDEDFRRAPSHRANAPLVHLVSGLSDEALREWVVGGSEYGRSGSDPVQNVTSG